MPAPKRNSARDLVIFLAFINLTVAVIIPWLPWWQFIVLYAAVVLTTATSLLAFFITRYRHLVKRRASHPVQWHSGGRGRPAEDYYLFVLGSGGHTREMLMMMDDGFCDFGRVHRRYLISSGDSMSRNHLEEFEQNLQTLCEKKGDSPGTYDTAVVTRARKVHQPLWSTPSSALQSMRGILGVLLSPPANAVGRKLQYPRIVVSNGPATGFIVAVAVFCLKMIYLIPEDRCFFVYIESWARISTLSLTGKLLYFTNIADAFAVQHKQVAETYRVHNIGPIVLNSRRDVDSDEVPTT